MKFIQLTAETNDCAPVFVAIDRVSYVRKRYGAQGSEVHFADNVVCVRENPEQVMALIRESE